MDSWSEAFGFANIVLSNSLYMWLVYISFFILALIVRKQDDKTRRITGARWLPGNTVHSMLRQNSQDFSMYAMACLWIFFYYPSLSSESLQSPR